MRFFGPLTIVAASEFGAGAQSGSFRQAFDLQRSFGFFGTSTKLRTDFGVRAAARREIKGLAGAAEVSTAQFVPFDLARPISPV